MEILKGWLPLVASLVALAVSGINFFSSRQLLREKILLDLEAQKNAAKHSSRLKHLDSTIDDRKQQTHDKIAVLIESIKTLQSAKDHFRILSKELSISDSESIQVSNDENKNIQNQIQSVHREVTAKFEHPEITPLHDAKNAVMAVVAECDHKIKTKASPDEMQSLQVKLNQLIIKLDEVQTLQRDQRSELQHHLYGALDLYAVHPMAGR